MTSGVIIADTINSVVWCESVAEVPRKSVVRMKERPSCMDAAAKALKSRKKISSFCIRGFLMTGGGLTALPLGGDGIAPPE